MIRETFVGTVGEKGAAIATLTEAWGANSVSVIWSPAGLDVVKR